MLNDPARPLVLFLCTGNSCRSQIAEALLRHMAGEQYTARSAGLDPKGIHPLTLRVLEEVGVSTEGLRSKSAKEFLGYGFVHVAIFVCSEAENRCPKTYPFSFQQAHSWPFEDPAAFQGTEDERVAKFREVRDQIGARIRAWLLEQSRKSRPAETRV